MDDSPFLLRFSGWRRLLLCAVVGGGVALLPWPVDGAARGLLGWCVGTALFLVLAFWLAERSDAQGTRERARALDQPGGLILASMLAVVGASLGAITTLLQQAQHLGPGSRGLHVGLAIVALAGSWLVIHTIFGFHYAHLYYQDDPQQPEAGPGLDFPGKLEPDYFDFLYYAFVVGMTSQVSDVQVTSRRMRRLTLVHSLLAFAFNMLVLALSINVVAGAI